MKSVFEKKKNNTGYFAVFVIYLRITDVIIKS